MIRIFLISMFSLSLMAQEKATNDDPLIREIRKTLASNTLSSPLQQADLIVFKEACQVYNVASSEESETANSASSKEEVKIRIQQNELGFPDVFMNYGEVAKGFKKISETFKNAFGKVGLAMISSQ